MNRLKREQQILNSAIAVFAKRGYDQTSVSDIIEESRVARGTFYLYFKNKKHIFEVILNRFFDQVALSVSRINGMLADSALSPLEQYRLLSADLIHALTQNRLLVKLLLHDRNHFEAEIAEKIRSFDGKLVQIVRSNIEMNIDAGVVAQVNADLLARLLIGGIKEIVAAWLLQRESELTDLAIDQLIGLLVTCVPKNRYPRLVALQSEEDLSLKDLTNSTMAQ